MIARLKKLPSALKQGLVYGSALALSKGVGLLMVPVFTRFLTPDDYGRLDILQTLADVLSIVIAFGLTDTLFRFAGTARDTAEQRDVAAHIFGLAVAMAVVSAALTQAVAPVIAAALPGDPSVLQTRLILASLSLSVCILIPLAWLRMRDKAGGYFAAGVGRVVLQGGLSAALLFLGFGVTGVMVAGFTAAAVVAGCLAAWQYRDTGIRFSLLGLRRFGVYGGPLVLTGVAGFVLGSFDRWLLADAVGPGQMAQYALAAKFALVTALLIQPFDMWWLPRRFAVLGEAGGAERAARIVALGVTIAILAAVCIAGLGPALVRALTPESYHGAIRYLPWLAALAAVHGATTLFNMGCYSRHTTLRPLFIETASAALALAGYVILIPRFGGDGAVVATAVALSFRLALTYWISQRTLFIPYPAIRLLALAALGVAVIAATQHAPAPAGQWAVLAAGAAGLLVLGLWLRVVPVRAI